MSDLQERLNESLVETTVSPVHGLLVQDYQEEIRVLKESLEALEKTIQTQEKTIKQLQSIYHFVVSQRDSLLINQANQEVNNHLNNLNIP